MTEEEARELVEQFTDRDGMRRLDKLVAMVLAENQRQNLIAASTMASIWSRHVLDSVQLLHWATDGAGRWLDIGTGGGFPGLAIAAASPRPMVLVEPRPRRAEFLLQAGRALCLDQVVVRVEKIEATGMNADVVSARAVAPIAKLLRSAIHCATSDTCWLLPRGSRYEEDVKAARSEWKGVFHVKQSLSNPAAGIVVAHGLRAR